MKKYKLAFAWAWIWFLAVGTGSACLYLELTEISALALAEVHWFSVLMQAKATSWAGWLLYWAAGVLFCWRFVKVLALQGSPLPFGMDVRWVAADAATKPMWAYGSCVGNFDVFGTTGDSPFYFWFGAVFRKHPNSDKLMRARLQFLTLAIWLGRNLSIVESRLGIHSHTHRRRAELFREHFDGLNSPKMSGFEKDSLKKLDGIKGAIKRLKPHPQRAH